MADASTTPELFDITDISDAALTQLLGMDTAETVEEAIDIWRDARTSCKTRGEMTPTERAGRALWGSKHCALDHLPRRQFAIDSLTRHGDTDAADLIRALRA